MESELKIGNQLEEQGNSIAPYIFASDFFYLQPSKKA